MLTVLSAFGDCERRLKHGLHLRRRRSGSEPQTAGLIDVQHTLGQAKALVGAPATPVGGRMRVVANAITNSVGDGCRK